MNTYSLSEDNAIELIELCKRYCISIDGISVASKNFTDADFLSAFILALKLSAKDLRNVQK